MHNYLICRWIYFAASSVIIYSAAGESWSLRIDIECKLSSKGISLFYQGVFFQTGWQCLLGRVCTLSSLSISVIVLCGCSLYSCTAVVGLCTWRHLYISF